MKKRKTIFQIELAAYEKIRRHQRDDYQPFRIIPAWKILYATLEEAEMALPDLIERFKSEHYLPLYWCKIVELPVGVVIRDSHENFSERLYDHNGRKVDERLFPTEDYMDCWHSSYMGRKPEDIRYKPGDVVEYRGRLCVVDGFMRPYKEDKKPFGDASDDGYTVWIVDEPADDIQLDSDGSVNMNHTHPASVDILPPRFQLSDKVKRRIENIRQFFSYHD